MDDIEAELRELRDHQQIVACLNRYSRGIDRCDVEIVESCFHPDAHQDSGMYVGSPRGWAEMVNEFHLGQCLAQQHHLTNSVIELDGDTAHVESYFFATVRGRDGTTKLVSGRWIDRFERREGSWRIAVRVSTTEMVADVATADMALADSRYVPYSRDRSDVSYERPLRPLRGSVKEPYRPTGDASTAPG